MKLQIESAFRVLALLALMSTVTWAQQAVAPVELLKALFDEIQKSKLSERLKEGETYPDSTRAQVARIEANEFMGKLRALQNDDELPPHFAANRDRYLGALSVSISNNYRKLAQDGKIEAAKATRQRRDLCIRATEDLTRAEARLAEVMDFSSQESTEARRRWVAEHSVQNHVNYLLAMAYASLFALDGAAINQEKARESWDKVSVDYSHEYNAEDPDLRLALGLRNGLDHVPPLANPATVIGGAVVLLGLLVISLFVKKPTVWQEYLWRVVLGLAAASYALILPGEFKIQLPNGVLATSTIAVFVLVYLFNPPRLLRQGVRRRKSAS